MKNNSKKLSLEKETFKTLTPDQLTNVAGGGGEGTVTQTMH
jgi:hypothetical protein